MSDLLPSQRHAAILDQIRLHGAASITQLAKSIRVSTSTIRRDLEELEASGHLDRVRGGAQLQRTLRSAFEPAHELAAEMARAEKRAIAIEAVKRLSPGQSVLLDTGTTIREFAHRLSGLAMPLTVVTNDIAVSSILATSSHVSVIVPGGTLRAGSMTLVGDPGLAFLRSLNADLAFLSTHAISEDWLSETSVPVAELKRALIGTVRRTILLADSSKFQPAAFVNVCELSRVDELITDSGIDPVDLKAARALGIGVEVVTVDRTAAPS